MILKRMDELFIDLRKSNKLHEDIVPASQILLDSTLFFVFTTNSDCFKLKQKFAEALKSEDLSAPKVSEMAYQLVDEWGEKFRDQKGLLETEEEEDETAEEEAPSPPL